MISCGANGGAKLSGSKKSKNFRKYKREKNFILQTNICSQKWGKTHIFG